jgi:hypothetical protein
VDQKLPEDLKFLKNLKFPSCLKNLMYRWSNQDQ